MSYPFVSLKIFRGVSFFSRSVFVFFLVYLPLLPSDGEGSVKHSLSLKEKESLRYHLENIFNEVDLLIKNHRLEASDLERQKHMMSEMKMFERIPFRSKISNLKDQLKKLSKDHRLTWINFTLLPKKTVPKAPPKTMDTHSEWRLSEENFVEVFHFKVKLKGSQQNITQWVKSSLNQLRLVELESEDPSLSIQLIGHQLWEVQARTFRFRNIQFPHLLPRNPRGLLPAWAKRNFNEFAQLEPLLWNFIVKTEAKIPEALQYYPLREQFLLNDARLNYVSQKLKNRSTQDNHSVH